ncbi:MAG: hypothetical protein ACRDRR_00675 [Pseudonocardiaceae bacterium]
MSFDNSNATQIGIAASILDDFADVGSRPSVAIYWEHDSLSLIPAQAVAMARDLLSAVFVLPAPVVAAEPL